MERCAHFTWQISGAFDRVSRTLLLGRLSEIGLPESFLDFRNSYLQPREGRVTLGSATSDVVQLSDMCFQGTCFGPALWNCFFGGIAGELRDATHEPFLFADDLTVLSEYPIATDAETLELDKQRMREQTLEWGRRNRVCFDANKEQFEIIHPRRGSDIDFRILGTYLDGKLRMKPCTDKMMAKICGKIKSILRLRSTYEKSQLISLYKSHVWSIMEFHTSSILLANHTELDRLDRAQRWFLHEIALSDTETFLQYNRAPPSIRRRV